ncbi:hypothetical protein FRC02_009788 [Tulasnella sp. 418]|nr:hypothetical protein FRC02_009788 [Tulasnella sp. 418]
MWRRVIRVFLEGKSDQVDHSQHDERDVKNARPLTEQEEEDAREIIDVASGLGLEDPPADLERLVGKAEMWALDLAPDEEAKKLVSEIEESLRKLREKLVYSMRLASLKAEVNRLKEEQEKFLTLQEKYKTLKQERNRAIEKFNLTKAELKKYQEREKEIWVKENILLEQQVEMERKKKIETERATAKLFSAKANHDSLIKQVEELTNERDDLLQKAAKWKKKYLAEKDDLERLQERMNHQPSSLARQEEFEDSLEIVQGPLQPSTRHLRQNIPQKNTLKSDRMDTRHAQESDDSDIEIVENLEPAALGTQNSRGEKRKRVNTGEAQRAVKRSVSIALRMR